MRLSVEMDIAGQGWTDITSDVFTRDPVTISRGRSNESTSINPAACGMTLDNRQYAYSPRNPRGVNFGKIGRNTPIRVSMPGAESYLELDGSLTGYASTPDAFDFSSGLDVRVEASTNWHDQPQASTLIGQFEEDPGDGWVLRSDPGGIINLFVFTTDGSSGAAAALPSDLPSRIAVRATWVADNGTGVAETNVYWAESMDGPWNHVFTYADTTAATALATTHALKIAPEYLNSSGSPRVPMTGRVYRAEVRSAVDGPVVASPDFRGLSAGVTGFTDSAGLTWTLNGSSKVSDRAYRFVGEVSEWATRWDRSGNDLYSPIQASGLLRRLGQGAPSLKSTLRRRVPSGNPVAYWPMEDGADTRLAYSPINGVQPITTRNLDFAAESSLPGSEPLPVLKAGARIDATVPAAAEGGWHVEFVYKLDEFPPDGTVCEFVEVVSTDSEYDFYRVDFQNGGLRLTGVNQVDDTEVVTELAFPIATTAVGDWTRFRLYAEQSGSDISLRLSWVPIGGAGLGETATFPGTVGRVRRIRATYADELVGMAIGHLGVFTTPNTGIYNFADHGFTGETALDRIRRLADEEGLPMVVLGAPADSMPVGPQQIATVLENLQQAADVDGGILMEQRESLGLEYHGRSTLYNPSPTLELDYAASEVMPPFQPVDDDQSTRNDVTVSRINGSSARAVLTEGPVSVQPPPTGVGTYDESLTLNANTDDQLAGLAHWRLHLGTVDESRYPRVTVHLTRSPHLVTQAMAVQVGSTIIIANPPAWLPPNLIRLRVEGWTETITASEWTITFNCSPGSPWVVGVAEADKVDTDGSELAADATDTDTSLLVHTPGIQWTTDPAEFPFDVNVGGEHVYVSAIGPGVEDDFSRSVTNGWGTEPDGLNWNVVLGDTADFDVSAGIGTAAPPPPVNNVALLSGINTPSCEVYAELDISVAPTLWNAWVGVVSLGSPSLYLTAQVIYSTSGNHLAGLYSAESDGTATLHDSMNIPWLTVGSPAAVRTWVDSAGTFKAKVWNAATEEPAEWQLSYSGTGPLTGSPGVAVLDLDAGVAKYSRFEVVSPQKFTVTRGVNGFTKSHSATTDVRLARPAVVAL